MPQQYCWLTLNEKAVFEIKGASGARGAHFRRRAHNFRLCAPVVRTFSLENKLILIHRGTGKSYRAHSCEIVAPAECRK